MLNTIIHGDCLEVMPRIPDKSIDLIIIDPPYLTTKEKWDKKEVVNEELSKQLLRVAKDSCSLYVWCGIGEKSQSLIRWFPIFDKGWHFKDLITWKKQRGNGMKKGWLYTREEIMWFVKDNKKFIWNKEWQYTNERRKRDGGSDDIKVSQNGYKIKCLFKRVTNIWDDFTEQNLTQRGEYEHFTPKPVKAIERIIKAHTKENDIVLDCFMGSGTMAVACLNLNRNYIGVEKEEKYIRIAEERIKEKICQQ